MNIAVINLKDILKYLIRIVIVSLLIIILINLLRLEGVQRQEKIIRETISDKTKEISKYSFKGCLDFSLSAISYSKTRDEREQISVASTILNLEIGMLDKNLLRSTDLVINENEVLDDNYEEIQDTVAETQENVIIERVSENNIPEKSTNSYNTVYVYNESDHEITETMLIPDIEITNKKDVFIYHAHTCESYTPSEQYNYEMTGNFRTADLNYNVVRTGSELANYLNDKGFRATHDKTYHDYPTYSGSYARALETVEKNLAGKDVQLVLDLHRDAIREQ